MALCHLLSFGGVCAGDFYIDSRFGNDANDGSSPETAWQSLERLQRQTYLPGDQIFLRAGSRFQGRLSPRGSGTVERPIRIARYGEGPAPRIDGEGKFREALLLSNQDAWEVEDLELTNQGPHREPWRCGVRVVVENHGIMRHIRLRKLFVHDVNGDLRKSHEGCGILFESVGKNVLSFFEGIQIEACHVLRTDRNGICQRNGSGPHSKQVVIRGNLLEDIGGDCIKTWGSDAPLIERNIVRGAEPDVLITPPAFGPLIVMMR